MNQFLARSIRRLADVPESEIERLEALLTPKQYRRGDRFLSPDTPGPGFGFVEKGLFRFFYLDERGTDATRAFITEGGFLASRETMFRGRPSSFTIEALEESRVLVAVKDARMRLAPAMAAWMPFFIAFMEERLDAKDRRIEGFLMGNAASRYRDFVAEFPDIERRARQHHIASYLGVTPVTLSRLRRNLAQ